MKEQPAANARRKPDEAFAEAVALAKRSDVVGAGAGRDRSDERRVGLALFVAALPVSQQELLEAVAATGKPVVLVLVNGRPLDISWAAGHLPAILEAWYPGTEGGNAIADVLFGDANPCAETCR